MKKKSITKIVLSTVVAAILIWAIPVGVGLIQAKPLSGSFLVARCGCGHDIFYLIENSQAFDYCPGHKEKEFIGPASRDGDFLRVTRATDSAPDFEIKLDKGAYFLRFAAVKNDDWNIVEQVSNPWRTSLRSYFPE